MRRMVHRNSSGFIEGTTTIYEEGEGPGFGELLTTILCGAIMLGFLRYVYVVLAPFLK
jgi:hypothetical protein